ncbi:hypothetical protein ACTHGU_17290 [Chitinophagaceae bacterium MMS25-I14]
MPAQFFHRQATTSFNSVYVNESNTYNPFMDEFEVITLQPELITTDNFKQLFPGVTLKIF